MKMDKDYALKKEEEGYILLEDFNDKVLKLQELGRTKEKSTTDASGKTIDMEVNIEIKKRELTLQDDFSVSGDSFTADTLFIEGHKAADMLLDYVCDSLIPLYVNFLNNGVVIVYNLSRLKHRPRKTSRKIWSRLYQGFELAKRQELQILDAWIYKKENDSYKLIHKP